MEAVEFKKILLAVDGSDHSMKATRYAIALAELCRAEVILLHSSRRIPDYIGEPYYQRMLDRMLAETDKLLRRFRDALRDAGVDFTERILEDDPAEDICTAAQVEDCDMIVMGARGVSDIQGVLMGSVSHKVLQKAPCPVLTVR